MSEIAKVAAAFVQAKKAFSPALKDKTNPAFRSKYADLGACLEAVNDALLENGIALYQETTEDPAGITIETVLLHESGESIRSGKLHVPAVKHDPQGFGSAMTYARRYSLMAACGIAPEDDDGNAGREAAERAAKAAAESARKVAELAARKYEASTKTALPDGTVADFIAMIDSGETIEAVDSAFAAAHEAAKKANDEVAYKQFAAARKVRKGALMMGA